MARNSLLIVIVCLSICTAVRIAPAQGPIWRPYVEFGGRAGSFRDIGQGNLFLPLWQDCDSLLFADLRGHWTDVDSSEGNWGLAYRTILPSEWIFGVYGFYDLRHSRFDNNFSQATVGVELLDVCWGFRVNGYVPESDEELTGSGIAFIQNNNLVVRAEEEAAYWGVDFEVERLLWRHTPCCGHACHAGHKCAGYGCQACATEGECGCGSCPAGRTYSASALHGWLQSLDMEIWAAAAYFHFDNSEENFDDISGPRVRGELRFYDLPMLGNDSRLVLSGQYEHDDERGSQASGMLTVRIPFGPGGGRSGAQLSRLGRRMVTPIVRDIDIITNTALSDDTERAKFARTGETISEVLIVDGATGTPGTVISGAQANSLVIAQGGSGDITPAATIDMPDGQVILGGGSGLLVIGCESGARAYFDAPGSRGTFSISAGDFVDLIHGADNARIQGVDLVTMDDFSAAIRLDNDTNVLIEDVQTATSGEISEGIAAAGASQFTLNNSRLTVSNDSNVIEVRDDSTFTINNSMFFGNDFTAIRLRENAQGTINDATINYNGGAGLAVADDSKLTVNNSTITGSDGPGILVGDSARLTMNGGAITTTGADGDGVLAGSFRGLVGP